MYKRQFWIYYIPGVYIICRPRDPTRELFVGGAASLYICLGCFDVVSMNYKLAFKCIHTWYAINDAAAPELVQRARWPIAFADVGSIFRRQ